jgi:hypothetical protein
MEDRTYFRIKMLRNCPMGKDFLSLTVIKMLYKVDIPEKAIFCLATFPLLLEHPFLNKEAINEIAKIFREVVEIDSVIKFTSTTKIKEKFHPAWIFYQNHLNMIPQTHSMRRRRALHLFKYILVKEKTLLNPAKIEKELNQSFIEIKKYKKLCGEDVISQK